MVLIKMKPAQERLLGTHKKHFLDMLVSMVKKRCEASPDKRIDVTVEFKLEGRLGGLSVTSCLDCISNSLKQVDIYSSELAIVLQRSKENGEILCSISSDLGL